MDCFDFCKQPKPCQDNLCINKDKVEGSNLRSNPESVKLPCSKINRVLSPISLHLCLSFCLSLLSFPPYLFQLFEPNSTHFLYLQSCQNTVAQQSGQVVLEIDFVFCVCVCKVIIQSVSVEHLKEDRGNPAARS